MPQHIKPTPEKYCENCGNKLERKRFKSGVLESLLHFGRRKYCNFKCMGEAFDNKPIRDDTLFSSAHWHSRKAVPPGPCVKCGVPNALDVHHKNGDYHDHSDENLERICRSCHNKEHKQRGSCVICGKPQKGHGYCNMHLLRWKKWGDPLKVKDNQFVPVRMEGESNPEKICSVPGCGKPYHAKGLCSRHAMQQTRGKLGTSKTKSEASKEAWKKRKAQK